LRSSSNPLKKARKQGDLSQQANRYEPMAIRPVKIEDIAIRENNTIRQALEQINDNSYGIVVVVDDSMYLKGTITDGDIRRAILSGKILDDELSEVLNHKKQFIQSEAIVAKEDTSTQEMLKMMLDNTIRHLPIVSESGKLVSLVEISALLAKSPPPLNAVIMAGGFGTRMKPLTNDIPKPMLPLGKRPVMEHIIDNLRESNISDVSVTTHYLAGKIKSHFKDGQEFGVNINYVSEDTPLGTGGALSLIEHPDNTVLVINGDIRTDVNFRKMQEFHNENGADITVGVRHFSMEVPFGVIEVNGAQVTELKEKPAYNFLINAGIYLLEPSVFKYIPNNGKRFDMTDLIDKIIKHEGKVVSFPIVEYWLDIGQHEDYLFAQEHEKSLDKKVV